MKPTLKMIVAELKELIAEARNEAEKELTEEECEREREIEGREYEMEIAEGGFYECLEMIDLPKEQKEKLAHWFGKYAGNARELIKLERQG